MVIPVVFVVAIVFFGINFIGALHGAMLCDFPHFVAGLYFSQMLSGHMRAYPLAPWLIAPFSISIIFLAWSISQSINIYTTTFQLWVYTQRHFS